MQLSRKQYEATKLLTDPTVNSILYGGAIRGAKTAWGAITFFQLAKTYPNSRWCMMRADTPKITTNLLPSVANFYSKPEIAKDIAGFNQNKLEYTLKNGSIIKMFPESFNQDKTLSRFLGLEMNGFFLDELSEYQQVTWENAFVRAGSWLNAEPNIWGRKPRPLVLASCNPSKNWVKEVWYDRWVDGSLATKKPSWRYVPAKITDNPWVEKSYYDSLKENMTPENYQRFVDGDWEYVERKGNEWLYKFDYTQHVKKVKFNPNLPTFLTYDFNVLPYQTLLCFQVDVRPDGVHVIRFYKEYCFESPRNNAKDVTQAWIKDYPMVHGPMPVNYCGDKSGENRVPGLGDINAFIPVKQTLERYLHKGSDMIFRRQFFNEFARTMLNDILSGTLPIVIEIDELNCPKLIRDIQESMESDKGGIHKEKVKMTNGLTYEKNGHCVDAFKYGMLSVFEDMYVKRYHNKQY